MSWPVDASELCAALKAWKTEVDALPAPKPLIDMRPADALALGPHAAMRVVHERYRTTLPTDEAGKNRLIDEVRAVWRDGTVPTVVDGTQGFWLAGLRLLDGRWAMLIWQEPNRRGDGDWYLGWDICELLENDEAWVRQCVAEKVERVIWNETATIRFESLDEEARTILEQWIIEDTLDLGSSEVWFHTVSAGPLVAMCSFSNSTLHISELMTETEYDDACEPTGHDLEGIEIMAPGELMRQSSGTVH